MAQAKAHKKSTVSQQLVRLRSRADLTQEQLAELANVSESMVKAIEQGTKSPSMAMLGKLARALDVSTSELLASGRGVRVAADPPPPEALLSVRRSLTPMLLPESDTDPQDLPTAAEWLDTLRYSSRLYTEDKYDMVLVGIPELLDEAKLLHAHRIDDGSGLAQAYLQTARILIQYRQLDLAQHALYRAMDAAQQVSDEVLAASIAFYQGWALVRQGRFDESQQLVTSTADAIEPRLSDPPSAKLTTWGWLRLSAASAAIRDSKVDEATEYLRQAKAAAGRLDGQPQPEPETTAAPLRGIRRFDSALVAYKEVEQQTILGNFGAALDIAEHIRPSRVPPPSDKNRHRLDVTAGLLAQNRQREAIGTLQDIKATDPEWLARQPLAGQLVTEIVENRKRVHANEVGVLADHVGVPY
jgi:transcriptional regulator with XRE-family HTH domain